MLESQGLSLRELAVDCGASETAITKMERWMIDRLSIESVARLSEALGADLLSGAQDRG